MDVTKAVNEIKGGKVQYRTDKAGNVQVIIGKVSFDEDKLKQNLLAIYNTILKARPSTVKGVYMKSLTISSTMGRGILKGVARLPRLSTAKPVHDLAECEVVLANVINNKIP